MRRTGFIIAFLAPTILAFCVFYLYPIITVFVTSFCKWVIDMKYTWGSDVNKAIINALMECAVSGTDIDARFEALQKELLALIG